MVAHGGAVTSGPTHATPAAHATPVAAGHAWAVAAWQTIEGPQSVSAAHGASTQTPLAGVGVELGAMSTRGHGAPAGQADFATGGGAGPPRSRRC